MMIPFGQVPIILSLEAGFDEPAQLIWAPMLSKSCYAAASQDDRGFVASAHNTHLTRVEGTTVWATCIASYKKFLAADAK